MRASFLAVTLVALAGCGKKSEPTEAPASADSMPVAKERLKSDPPRRTDASATGEAVPKSEPIKDALPKGEEAKSKEPSLVTELLSALPKDRWPENKSDSLRYEQSRAWLKQNLVGKRARWIVTTDPMPFTFSREPNGVTFSAMTQTRYPRSVTELYGGSRWLQLANQQGNQAGHIGVLDGLSESEAESLRALPNGKAWTLLFTISGVQLTPEAITVYTKDRKADITTAVDPEPLKDPNITPLAEPFNEYVTLRIFHDKIVFAKGEEPKPGFINPQVYVHAYKYTTKDGKTWFGLRPRAGNVSVKSEITDKDGKIWVVQKAIGGAGADTRAQVELKP